MDFEKWIEEGLAPDPEALEAVAQVIGVLRLAAPPLDASLDRLLLDACTSFHSLACEVLSTEDAAIGGGPGITAGLHVRAIANLLTVLSLRSGGDAQRYDEAHAREYSMRWLKAIVDVCCSDEPLVWHPTPTHYLRITASVLANVSDRVRAEPQLSLEPEDPRIRTLHIPEEPFGADVETGIWLVRCAASALWIAAAVAPAFRLPPSSVDMAAWPPTETVVQEVLDDLTEGDSDTDKSPLHYAVLGLLADMGPQTPRQLVQRLSATYDRPPTVAAVRKVHA